jgi:hypothetical protein
MEVSKRVRGRIAAAVSVAALLASGVLVGALPASAAADYSAVVLASKPLAYWRLNEPPGSTTAADDTGHGYNGTYASCVQLGLKGPIRDDPDTAGFFGAKPGCWMTHQPTASYKGSYSVEAWVRPHSTAKDYQTWFDTRGPDGEYSFDIKFLGSDNPLGEQLCTDVGDGSEWLEPAGCDGDLPFAFSAGHWYYIAATINAASHILVLYVNGSVFRKLELRYYGLPPLLFDPDHPITIGGNARFDTGGVPGHTPENFDGTIGQVAIYKSVLTPAEVKAHYKAGHD